jgi:FtsZ-binding cell division protein ZapB
LKEESRNEMERLQMELDELKEDYDELNARHTGIQETNEELE